MPFSSKPQEIHLLCVYWQGLIMPVSYARLLTIPVHIRYTSWREFLHVSFYRDPHALTLPVILEHRLIDQGIDSKLPYCSQPAKQRKEMKSYCCCCCLWCCCCISLPLNCLKNKLFLWSLFTFCLFTCNNVKTLTYGYSDKKWVTYMYLRAFTVPERVNQITYWCIGWICFHSSSKTLICLTKIILAHCFKTSEIYIC